MQKSINILLNIATTPCRTFNRRHSFINKTFLHYFFPLNLAKEKAKATTAEKL